MIENKIEPRKITAVITTLIEDCQDADMKKSLEHIQETLKFTAPELMFIRWEAISSCLMDNMSRLKNEVWFRKELSFFSATPIEKVNDYFDKEKE